MIDQFHIFHDKITVIYTNDNLRLISLRNVNNIFRMVFDTWRMKRYGRLVFGYHPAAPTDFSIFLCIKMAFSDSLPVSSPPSPPPEPFDTPTATPIKHSPTSALHHSVAPAPRSSALFAPTLSDLAASSPAAYGSSLPSAPSSPAPHPPAPSASSSASPASDLRTYTAPTTAPRDSRPPRDWGDVLDPPPPAPPSASVYGLVSSLDLVYIPPGGGGEVRSATQNSAVTHCKSVIVLQDHTFHHSL